MVSPSFLKRGDLVGVCAPAGKISREQLMPALDLLHKWGLETNLAPHTLNSHFRFSGNDKERLSDLQLLLNNPNIKAILCARGGYGTLRIIDKLDFTSFKKHPKWIVGYSDITVLHAHIHQKLKTKTIHGTMPVNFLKDAESTDSLRKCLFAETIFYETTAHPLNKQGQTEGELIGGNLSILYALQGSISDINTDNKILFIEDVGEHLYHIDRMMISLKRSGKLKKLKGLIVGNLTELKDNTEAFGKTAEEIILDAVSDYDYPICFNFPSGHATKNLALVFGQKARLSVEKSKTGLAFL